RGLRLGALMCSHTFPFFTDDRQHSTEAAKPLCPRRPARLILIRVNTSSGTYRHRLRSAGKNKEWQAKALFGVEPQGEANLTSLFGGPNQRSSSASSGMGKKDPRVDAYFAKAAPFARPILRHVRKLVHQGCPEVEETMKWSMPHFEYLGIMLGMAAFKEHCSIGFWKGDLIMGK